MDGEMRPFSGRFRKPVPQRTPENKPFWRDGSGGCVSSLAGDEDEDEDEDETQD
ncbi:hypothetical protein E4U61_007814 [Claviceps capensis]|nr:hypothetical protein E4U61_007814 [Claviceps capensis]